MKIKIVLLGWIAITLFLPSCGTPENPSDPLGDFPTRTAEAMYLNTGEARVRYILADIQLSGLYDYYAGFTGDAEAMDAIQRWDQGIRVLNIDQFERKMVGGNWSIVYIGTETSIDGMDVMLSEIAPVDEFEARVRYILVDIQLSGDGYYRSFPDDPWAAEAIRRWDQGIRIANIGQFERKIVGTWQIVYFGTETTIDGMDVVLTEVAGEATIRVGIAYPTEGGHPIPGTIYLDATNLDNGSVFSTSWQGDWEQSLVVSAPGRYRVSVIVEAYGQRMPFKYSLDCSTEMDVYVNPGEITGSLLLILCP